MGLAGELKALIGGVFIAFFALLQNPLISLQIQQPKQSCSTMEGEKATASTSDARSHPADAAIRPADAASRPSDAASRPADAASRPADAPIRPADAASRSADAASRPADAASRPADTASRPADAASHPADAPSRPADHSVSQTILEAYGLHFNEHKQLVDYNDDPFMFNLSSSHKENQARYEEVGTGVEWYLNEELETMLNRVPVREDGKGTTIFVSDRYEEKECLLVLIHGSGAVRAGMWSRRIMVNDNLYAGSQIPYIKRALANDWGVVVTNTNDYHNFEGSRGSSDHGRYVWKRFINKSRNKKIAIVAHSAGGGVTTDILGKYESDFRNRVFAIAYTDSFGFPSHSCRQYFLSVTTNWVASSQPLGVPVRSRSDDTIYSVSAGTTMHEWTSHCAIEEVFEYIVDSFNQSAPGKAVKLAKKRREKEQPEKEERERAKEERRKRKDEEHEMGSSDFDMDAQRQEADEGASLLVDPIQETLMAENAEIVVGETGVSGPDGKPVRVENKMESKVQLLERNEMPMEEDTEATPRSEVPGMTTRDLDQQDNSQRDVDVSDAGSTEPTSSGETARKDKSMTIKELRALRAQISREDAAEAEFVSPASSDATGRDRSLDIKELRALRAQISREDAAKSEFVSPASGDATGQDRSLGTEEMKALKTPISRDDAAGAQEQTADLSSTNDDKPRSRAHEDNPEASAATKVAHSTVSASRSTNEHKPVSPQQQTDDIPGVHRSHTETAL